MTDEHDPDISELYRATRTAEPTAALDEKVLAQARRAARQRRRRWLLPLSTAAVVMVGLTLTLRMVDQEKHLPTMEDYAVEQEAPSKMLERRPASPRPMLQERTALTEMKKEKRLRTTPPATDMAVEPSRARPLSAPAKSLDRLESVEQEEGEIASGVSIAEPRRWLQEIERLIETNQTEQAKAALLKFRRAYPDYPIPERLRAFIGNEDASHAK